MYDITEALIRRGYTDSDIRGVLGENFRRALGEIWDA
jgi:membrane dipeptidase